MSSSQYLYYKYYLSTDNTLDENTDTRLYINNTILYNNTSGSLYANSDISSSTAEGTYYMIGVASYTYNGRTMISNSISAKINVKKFIDHISITGMNVPKDTYIRSETFTSTLTITNENLKSQQLSINMYTSEDENIDYSTNNLGSISSVINPGINVITISCLLNNYSTGSYYLLARVSYISQSGNYAKLDFAGPYIQIIPPIVSISGISLLGTANVDVGDFVSYIITTVSDLQSDYAENLPIETYLSTDNVWSVDDISAVTTFIYYTQGGYSNDLSLSVPATIVNGTYYIIVRYKKKNEDTYTNVASSAFINVKSASAILFRNTQNTNYSTLYLFIDDLYVKTLDCYSTLSSPTCAAFAGSYCNYYSGSSNFYYKFFGSDGSHTFKLRTTNSINTGATLYNGTFIASSSACVSVDAD